MDTKGIEQLAAGVRAELLKETGAALRRVLTPGSTERLTAAQKVQDIEKEIEHTGEEALVDRVASTWFNRLCALRFMDVHGYTPVGMVSPREGATTIALLADAQNGVFPANRGISEPDKERITGLLSGAVASHNPLNDAYKELLRAVCKHYAGQTALGALFGGKDSGSPFGGTGSGLQSAVDLLMPNDLVSQDSLVKRICAGMSEQACESVEVLGWLYQFYIAERKDEVFAGFKKNKKAGAAELAPATQLFTPNWIVRYMVENSLGRLWLLNKPNSRLREHMDYYLESDPSSHSGLDPQSDSDNRHCGLNPQSPLFPKIALPTQISCLDPACGSGHILVYMFDLLYLMYEESGYQPEDIPALILENNLTGFEIDPRAAEIARFALAMKALERDPEFLQKNVAARIAVFESIEFTAEELVQLPLLSERTELLSALAGLNQIGSLYQPKASDLLALCESQEMLSGKEDLFAANVPAKLDTAIAACEALTQQFEIVVANPPYMGNKNMNTWLSAWLKENYPDEKSDLCTCFIERGFTLAKATGYSAMVTMESWMFLSSYEKMRKKIIEHHSILSLLYMNHMVMRIAFNTSATVFSVAPVDELGAFMRINYKDLNEKQEPPIFPITANGFYRRKAQDFQAIPGTPLAYWATPAIRQAFLAGKMLKTIAEPKQGTATTDNAHFLRQWYEVAYSGINFIASNGEEAALSRMKWFPYNKGGEFRKWYGNNDYVVNYQHDGKEIKASVLSKYPYLNTPDFVVKNQQYYFHPSITWSKISSGNLAFRYKPAGNVFDVSGCSVFAEYEQLQYIQGLCNSIVIKEIAGMLSPTLNFEVGQIATYPVLESPEHNEQVCALVEDSRTLSQQDWDSYETSWDFVCHPLIDSSSARVQVFGGE